MTYRTLHRWVERHKGKPSICEFCKTEDSRRYHWSNISGEYKQELNDWQRLCVPCHKKYDNASSGKIRFTKSKLKETCKNGHTLSGRNIRIRIIRDLPNRVCVECQRNHLRAYRRRLKLIEN